MEPRQRIQSPRPPVNRWNDPLVEQARVARERFTEWVEGRRTRVAVWTAVGAVVITSVAVWAATLGGDPGPDCPPPLELRVLTSPESRDTFADAAAAYETSGANRPGTGGCRATRLTVYSATSDNVAEGFAHVDTWNAADPADATSPGGASDPTPDPASDTEGFQPLTRVGPQPDIWIPDTTAELDLVRQSLAPRGVVELSQATPVAYSPLVLGLPSALEPQLPPGSADTAASTWDDLLGALDGLKDPPRLLRPGPTTSGAGLLHTVGRYLAGDGTLPRPQDDVDKALERDRTGPMELQMSTSGYPADDSSPLLGTLKDRAGADPGQGLDNVGVLVSEKALVDFNESDEPGTGQPPTGTPSPSAQCPDFHPVPQDERLTAYYPKGVPALDHPFVRVSWLGADGDRSRRTAAVQRFRDWLLGDQGQDQLARAHYRPAGRGDSAAPSEDRDSPLGCEGTGAEPGSPVYRADLPAPRLQQVLDAYEQARSPGQVLVLFDVSPSMREDSKEREAERVAASALDVLGPNDTFGVWAYPKSDRDPIGHRGLVPLGAPREKVPEGKRAVREAPLGVTAGAALYEVLEEAVDTMRAQGERPGKQAILLVTDRGDDKIGGRDLEGARNGLYTKLAAPGAPRVPILVADVSRPGCGSDLAVIAHLSSESSECLPAAQDVAKKLASLLAVVQDVDGEDGP